jgi:hypothetical protein
MRKLCITKKNLMEEQLDFGNANLDDFKIGGQESQPAAEPTVDKAPETVAPSTTETPAETTPPPTNTETPKADKAETPEVPSYSFKDDFIKGAVEYYEKTGDLTPYLQAKTVDFNAMADEDIMRRELREQYPDVSDKAFDKLFKQQVVDKFKLDPEQWEEDDVDLGKQLLKSEAAKLRSKYQDWQNGFKAPEPEVDNNIEDAQRALQEFAEKTKANEVTRAILESKRIAIKDGENVFNYELSDPSELLDMTVDNTKFFTQFVNGEGSLDYAKWYKTAAYAKNPEQFEKSLINYGKTLGREEITKEIKNPSTNVVGDVPTESSGDFTTGLLQAFANRGVNK